MRSRGVFLLGLTLALVSSAASADDKDDCFNAAEQAQKLKTDKKLSQARPALITCSRDVCPQQVRADCVKWLGEVDRDMSTVVVRARDANGHDVIDVKVFVDGELLLSKLQGTAVAVDPGQHKVRYEFPSGKTVEEDVLIAEGEKNRVLRAELQEGAGASTAVSTTTTGAATQSQVGSAETSSKGGPGAAPWIIGGVGLAALGVFIGLEADIQSTYSGLKNTCAPSCDPGKVSALQTEIDVAGVMFGVAIAGVVTSATWLIFSAVTRHSKSSTTGAFGVAPVVGGGGFASYGHSF
jgi:hypothetical protein